MVLAVFLKILDLRAALRKTEKTDFADLFVGLNLKFRLTIGGGAPIGAVRISRLNFEKIPIEYLY